VAVILALSLPVTAQVQYGAITGTVTDPTGAVIPEADVTISRVGGGVSRSVKTNNAGNYRISELPVGEYKVEVGAEGFSTAVTNVDLAVGVVIRVDFSLQLGARAEVVTVEAGVALIQTESGQLSEQVRGRQIEDLPLNGRNVYDLIQLAPGASNAAGVSFENGESTVVNGMRPNFNGFLINGVANRQLSGGSNVLPNPDLVEEFQMLTLNTSAQYGNVAGSVNNLVTKSGTNDFHGSAFWFFRNDKLDANEFFRNLNASSDPTSLDFALNDPSKVRFNQFGATGTGRIIRDKLFWTASYEGSRFHTAAAAVPIVIETPQWRQAISAFATATGIGEVGALLYDNFATQSVGTPLATLTDYVVDPDAGGGFGSTAFADYLCEDFAAARTAQAFASLFGVTAQDQTDLAALGCSVIPALQVGFLDTFFGTGVAGSGRTIPLFNSSVSVFGAQSQTFGDLAHGDRASARLDYSSTNHHIFGELWYYETRDEVGPANNSSGPRGIKNPQIVQAPNLSASWVWTASPTVINDLRLGFSRNSNKIAVDANAGVPSIVFGDGSAGFGSYNGYPQFFTENVYTYADMVSITKGNHNMKMGVDYKDNRENSEFNVGRPSYSFYDQLFFAIDEPNFVVAGVDPGFVDGTQQARLATNNRAWYNFEVGMYFQDDWKVTPNLTLNLGIRYDYFDRHKERFGRTTTFILPGGTSIADQIAKANEPIGSAGCSTPSQINQAVLAGICGPGGFAVSDKLGAADRDNFGPRFGMAWAPFGGDKTVIRAGLGVSFEGTLYNPLSNSRWNPPFYSFNLNCNDLFGCGDLILYGPTVCDQTVDPSTANCVDSGAAPSFSGGTPNPGAGTGVLGIGNIQAYFPGNSNAAFLTGIVFPEGIDDPWVLSYHAGFQHEIVADTVLEVNYVGTRGKNLFRAEQVNRQRGLRLPGSTAGADGAFNSADDVIANVTLANGEILQSGGGRQFLNPNYGNLRVWSNSSDSWYNALQASVRKRMSHGFMASGNYTWSHTLDTGSGWHSGAVTANGAAAGDGYSLDPDNPGLDKGNSTFDIRHRFVANWLWDLPFGQNATGAARKLLHGWTWNGVISTQSGAHWTPYDSRARNYTTECTTLGITDPLCVNNGGDYNADGTANDRPDVGPAGTNISASTNMWANGWLSGSLTASDLFATPCLGCNGNYPRNALEGPGQFNIDSSIFKNTQITEQVTLQFRFEVFNIFNHSNFLLPSSSTGANFANRVASGIFGASAGTLNARNIQFGLKVIW